MDISPEHYFILKSGRVIKDLKELISVLKSIDKETFGYHVNDSKNDFANWIRYVFKSKKLAETIEDMRFSEIRQMTRAVMEYASQVNMLVVNGGSSSLKFQLLELRSKNILVKGVVDAIGLERCNITLSINGQTIVINEHVSDHDEAVGLMIRSLLDNDIIGSAGDIMAIGHRVVHGAEKYTAPVLLSKEIIEDLKGISPLAPLHNPANIKCIEACMRAFRCPNVAVFDTAFHSSIPKEKFLYGLPYEYYDKYHIRKYGFHGSSHKYVNTLLSEYYRIKKKKNPKIIICHLGNGSSITAIRNGKSLNTTMGFTPLDGLIMGTRCGHLDPAVSIHIGEMLGLNYEQLGRILNKESGLLGISGYSDMRDIKKTQAEDKSKLALKMFADRVTHYIGAYIAELGGIDGIAFTAGIGENAWYVRKMVLDNFRYVGLVLDEKKNTMGDFIITSSRSKVTGFVVKTNEELQIATEVKNLLKI